jgi:dUTP pyrophosphatase
MEAENFNVDSDIWSEIQKKFNEISEEAGIEPDDETQKKIESLLGMSFDEMDRDMDLHVRTRTIGVKKLSADSVSPKYNYGTDSGFDLHSTEQITIPPFGRVLVPTGLVLQFEEGYEIQVRPKSGLAINMGLTVLNTPGTVDQGYSGEIKVIIFNTNNLSVIIEKGMKIGQAVLCPVINGKFVKFVDLDEVGETERGDNGFGSTGI